MNRKTLLAVAVVLLVLGVLVIWSGNRPSFAQHDPAEEKARAKEKADRADLQKLVVIFQRRRVLISFENGRPQELFGRITGVEYIFGKRFLRLEDDGVTLVLADRIVAIVGEGIPAKRQELPKKTERD